MTLSCSCPSATGRHTTVAANFRCSSAFLHAQELCSLCLFIYLLVHLEGWRIPFLARLRCTGPRRGNKKKHIIFTSSRSNGQHSIPTPNSHPACLLIQFPFTSLHLAYIHSVRQMARLPCAERQAPTQSFPIGRAAQASI